MLTLKNVVKDYVSGDGVVKALKGVSIDFRDNEFVSILGPSGCGKTTLLNIVGGLDRYTTGDLVINGVSTKEFKDSDWDSYRNHTIGFVFQTYNLIMHQTVLGNVELALTLSGVSPKERKELAIKALERVGLKDQINKKPNQLSGGQMQRVAIARAIVNNPDIILADEPTGALDTQTSVQIMDILKEIAKEKSVIMVTHNPDLAEKYSTRIIRLQDGEVVSDTNPVLAGEEFVDRQAEEEIVTVSGEEVTTQKTKKSPKTHKNKQKTKMSFLTALQLSLKNLLTKKARTILVSFAGSIGIIGIALILSISDGFQMYINKVQEDTLSNYPLTIEAETVDMTGMVSAIMGVVEDVEIEKEPDKIYSNNIMHKMLISMLSQQVENNLVTFKKELEANEELADCITATKYTYDLDLQVYFEADHPLNKLNALVQINPSSVFNMGASGGMASMASMVGMSAGTWSEMLDNPELLKTQYDLVGENSRWPVESNEVLVVVDSDEEISDYILYALGLLEPEYLAEIWQAISTGKEVEARPAVNFTYDDILSLEYKLLLQPDRYEFVEGGSKVAHKSNEDFELAIENSMTIDVVGIVKPKKSATSTSITGTIGFLPSLTEEVIRDIGASPIVQRQLGNPKKDVFTDKEFEKVDELDEYTIGDVKTYLRSIVSNDPVKTDEIVNAMVGYFVSEGLTEAEAEDKVISYFKDVIVASNQSASYERNLKRFGYVELDNPKTISIYPKDFESKDKLVAWIEDYNARADAEKRDEDVISYTDYIGIMMSSISTIINAISYVLIGFVSISLVVSSIMIGVITYISVLERTKEIGILRSIGASKKDISHVFNAETFIVGFVAGVLGVLIAMLIDIPINLILGALAGLYNIAAVPVWGAIGLIVISVVLTLISGIIPSRLAAKRDPVVALRSE